MTRPATLAYALFDFDGVIADTEPLYQESDRRALVALGYEPTPEELRSFIGHPTERLAPKILAAHGIDATPEQVLANRNVTRDIYGNPALKPNPGLAELWQRLRETGAKVAVVSTSHCADIVLALDLFGLLGLVDVIVGREHVEKTKPDPDPYLRALAFLAPGDATAASRAVIFEDSPAGIASAKAAGAHVVAYQGSDIPQDASAADEKIRSFQEFTDSLARG